MLGGRAVLRGKATKRFRQLVVALTDPAALVTFVRAMRKARLLGTAPATALSSVKYLGVYLADHLRPRDRRQAIMFHHEFLASHFPPETWSSAVVLWTQTGDGPQLSVVMRAAELAPMEGEHELVFLADGRLLCTLTFIIVAGTVMGLRVPRLMFIGGVQGPLGARETIRAAAKANGEIAPAAMLMIAAKALAYGLDVPQLVGLQAGHHPARHYADGRIWFDYDQLWFDAGATLDGGGWFTMPPRLRDKPIEQTARNHRSRTRRKRERKARIFAAIVAQVASRVTVAVASLVAPVVSVAEPILVLA